ncbi:uncharacterized protein LOC144622009 [Crassostrea virginica]
MLRVAIVLLSCYCVSGRARHCALFGFHPRGVRTLPECAIICGSLSQCTNFTFCKDKDLNYCVMYGKLRSNACAKYNEQTMNFYKLSTASTATLTTNIALTSTSSTSLTTLTVDESTSSPPENTTSNCEQYPELCQ